MELKNVKITRIGSKDKGSPYFKIGCKQFKELNLDDKKLYDLTVKEAETKPIETTSEVMSDEYKENEN